MMFRTLVAAPLFAALLAPLPAAAQSVSQEEIDTRYDRALAAGYMALFLCSALANAERAGTTRSPESVMEWELTGIQSPLDKIVEALPYQINREPQGASNNPQVASVAVRWADDMRPRIALHNSQDGCNLLPIEGVPPPFRASRPRSSDDRASAAREFSFVLGTQKGMIDSPADALDEVFENALEQRYGDETRTTAVLVHTPQGADGTVERAYYRAGFNEHTPQRTWSVAKSIAATLVGAAVQRGETDVARSAGLGENADDPRRAITIDHLLRMASGRYSDTPGNRTDALYFGGSTVEETALHWPVVHTPGSTYRYANNDTLAAVMAIDDTFESHPPAELFAKLGMTATVAETDWQGDYVLSSQVWSNARDLARFGQLYLDDGLWNGERILPEGWTQYVSSPSGPQPDGPFGYGAGFWLLNNSEGVPQDTYAAMGNRGQYVVIVPSRDVVLVRRGEDPTGSRFDIAAFTRDVLAALGD